MLCALDDFAFESHGVNIEDIQRNSSYQYTNHELINYFDHWQDIGKYKQQITLSGLLVQQKNSALDDLHRLAEQKKAVTLAFDNGRAMTVLITEVNVTQSFFLKNGEFLKQDFEVVLQVTYGNV